MEKWVKGIPTIAVVVSLLFLLGGIVSGIMVYDGDIKDNYELSRDVLERIPDNELAQQELAMWTDVYYSNLTLSLGTVFGGVASALIFMSLGTIVWLLGAIYKNKDVVINQEFKKAE